MPRRSYAQRRQQALAQVLFQAGGSLKNLSRIVAQNQGLLDARTLSYVESAIRKLQELDKIARQAMQADAQSRRAFTNERPKSMKGKYVEQLPDFY